MKSQIVEDYRDLQRRVRELGKKFRDRPLVYRGQVKFYAGGVSPSIVRPGHEQYLRESHPFWHTVAADILFESMIDYQQWLRQRSKGLNESRRSDSSELEGTEASGLLAKAGAKMQIGRPIGSHIEQILQHYGARSQYVDVTKSLRIALWFAHHRHRHEEVPLLPEDVPNLKWPLERFGPLPVYDVAWYEPAWPDSKTGYLFVLSPNLASWDKGLTHGDFIDLNPNYMATRIGRQEAGLVYADISKQSGNLRGVVRGIFRFNLPLVGAPRFVTRTKTQTLFPSPEKDMMYREILSRMPFRNEVETPFALHRALRIPEYYQSYDFLGSRQWSEFRRRDQYFPRTFFFAVLGDMESPHVMYQTSGRRFRVRDAIPILCPLSITLYLKPTSSSAFNFSDEGRGLFFEFDPIRTGVIPQDAYSPDNARGIWIVRKENTFWCRVFRRQGTNDSLSLIATHGHRFHLKEGMGLTLRGKLPQPGSYEELEISEEQDFLDVALGLLADVSEGKRRLEPSVVEPYRVLTETYIKW